ncbi:NADP-dependent oxidoreductase [Nesterenkonia alba]|uniref:NADP-dependent oxidoreductase n=1 Tax=Nesterenkonia alba TaxID=515814 RepID=UPI0003B54003|nr:NADP-dependent oxidoreductase [Nesterenkonia alba]
MRAATYSHYGDPSVLEVTEQPAPKLGPSYVLIRVERAAVNPVDWKLMAGYLDEMLDVVFPVIPGWDVAGVVEAVGPDVPEFQPGDRVASYARQDFVHGGTYAEYVSVRATDLAHVPDEVSFEAAAGLPLAGLTAARSREALKLRADDTLLIHAAAGGVGFLGAQLARACGATVIGTASERNHQKLQDIGVSPVTYGDGLVDRVRDIAPEGVTAVADFAGGVLDQTRAVLTPQGRHISIADPTVVDAGGRWIWVRPDGPRLERLLEKVAEGELRVDIDTVYPLEQAAQALQHNIDGASGKILIDPTV